MLTFRRPPANWSIGGDLTGQLGQPHLAHPHGEQQVDLLGVGGDRSRERRGVDAEVVARWQQDVVEAAAISGLDDVTAVFPRR